jgi:hypothetical protein
MWMQPAPAHHLGPMRMRLREPAWINPLCRVASHALFGLWLRSGSPPVPDRRKLPESADHASGNFRKAGKCCAVGGRGQRWEPDRGKWNHGLHGIHGLCSALPSSPSVSIRAICVVRGQSFRHIPERHIHLADHSPKPPGSNRTLSPMAATQAGTKSPALAEGGQCDREQDIDLRADGQTAPIHPKPIPIPRPNVESSYA